MNHSVLDNRFRIDEPIAKSVSGGVFRGTDLTNDQRVALKLLYMPQGADENFGVRFKREANVLFEIAHPNVVRIVDAGFSGDGVLYYAMELVNGVPLDRVLNVKGRLTLKESVDLIDQLAAALDAVHAHRIVHRDVTPSNIMIETLPDGRERLKLIDFGFAKDLGMSATLKGGPATGRLMLGVAAYLSPEVLSGKTATPLSDIHALGVVATLMLTGKHPFQRESEVGTIGAVLEEAPPRFAELCPEVSFPAGVEETVRRALAKKPSQRPATAGEFAHALRTALADVGIASDRRPDVPASITRNKPQLRPPSNPKPAAAGSGPTFAKHAAAAQRPPSLNGPFATLAAPTPKAAIATSAWFVPTLALAGVVSAALLLFKLFSN